jgi:hypothetical protein
MFLDVIKRTQSGLMTESCISTCITAMQFQWQLVSCAFLKLLVGTVEPESCIGIWEPINVCV